MKTRDIDIRKSLHSYIANKFSYDKTTKIVNELQVCYGSARIDVAAINGSLYGFEIKSESDTLERLPQQVEYYNKVFDYITLVCSENFIIEAEAIIPRWWGVYVAAVGPDNSVCINVLREPTANNTQDSFALAQCLWKDELVKILTDLGADKKIQKLQKYKLWRQISEACSIDLLKHHVKFCLKQRTNWKSDLQHT